MQKEEEKQEQATEREETVGPRLGKRHGEKDAHLTDGADHVYAAGIGDGLTREEEATAVGLDRRVQYEDV